MDIQQPTPRIVFRSGKTVDICLPHMGDMLTVTRMANNPRLTKYTTLYTPMPYEVEVNDWYARIIKRSTDEYVFFLVIRETNTFIGTMGLHGVDLRQGFATTGAMIDEPFQGKGYGTDAKMTMLHWAFTELNLRKIYSSVLVMNTRSRSYLKMTGYREVGVRRAHALVEGVFVDEVMLELFREDFMPLWDRYQKE